jgi:hypothetical protein
MKTYIKSIRKRVNRINRRRYINLLFAITMTNLIGCKDLVEVDPPITSVSSSNVFTVDATACAALTSIYVDISSSDLYQASVKSISLYCGLSADELTLFKGSTNLTNIQYYKNQLNGANANGDFWRNLYPIIYNTNSAIEGLSITNTLTPDVKRQLLGEAKFIRAFCYFYLVNLYGDVPLIKETDYLVNSKLSRTSKEVVYQQIIEDLKDSQALLNSNYVDGGGKSLSRERIRPNKWVATSLLARIYLYHHDWSDAEIQSNFVINNSTLYNLVDLDDVFKSNNNEAIWQLQPVRAGRNTEEAQTFILTNAPDDGDKPVYLSENQILAFEPGDQRFDKWVNSLTVGGSIYYYPNKYKALSFPITVPATPATEYTTVFRLAEQYLIRAEARIRQNKVSLGIEDLNLIRARATDNEVPIQDQLPQLSKTQNQVDALTAVAHERRIELFTEWGDRWFDLKRTGKIDEVMTVVTPEKSDGGAWKSYQQLYPIPASELKAAPQLVPNPGYY